MMNAMKFGALDFRDVTEAPELVAAPVRQALAAAHVQGVYVAEIDPALSDTAAFCERYGVGMDVSANCIILEAKRADKVWYAACVVLATTRADVNGAIRKQLEARKISFAPMDKAVALTGMEYGAITPIGLPEEWPVLVDTGVASAGHVIIGSGVRRSKLLVQGQLLASLPQASALPIAR